VTGQQQETLQVLCERYKVPFDATHYTPVFDLPDGYVAGWIGGPQHASYERGERVRCGTIYVGVSPEGDASS
jgi:hypothetical protein